MHGRSDGAQFRGLEHSPRICEHHVILGSALQFPNERLTFCIAQFRSNIDDHGLLGDPNRCQRSAHRALAILFHVQNDSRRSGLDVSQKS